ncbi:hypothetical protein PLESTF_000912100 [Pleodorina starrii]|nr:hypothetical protein PLESTF_000912100 [Pleodorina starrii]
MTRRHLRANPIDLRLRLRSACTKCVRDREVVPNQGVSAKKPCFACFRPQLCKCIPAGKVSTYGAMASVLQSSPRAVGQALRRNPFAPVVPCHRVVAADLSLGGFSGAWGIADPKVQRKKRMLEEEGVEFSGCAVLNEEFVLGPEELRSRLAQVLTAGGSTAKSGLEKPAK